MFVEPIVHVEVGGEFVGCEAACAPQMVDRDE